MKLRSSRDRFLVTTSSETGFKKPPETKFLAIATVKQNQLDRI